MNGFNVLGMMICMALLTGCSQNYSEKTAGEALREADLQAQVGGVEKQSSTTAEVYPDRQGDAGSGARQSLEGISVIVPQGWSSVTPSSNMRKAEYLVPGEEAKAGDASLAVFYFGPNQGGSVEANIERWIGQFSQSDGSSTRDRARRWKKQVDGMSVDLVDISGTYSGGMGPMGQSQAPSDGYRMLGAISKAPVGLFFFKLTGPAATLALWAESFEQFIDSMQVE